VAVTVTIAAKRVITANGKDKACQLFKTRALSSFKISKQFRLRLVISKTKLIKEVISFSIFFRFYQRPNSPICQTRKQIRTKSKRTPTKTTDLQSTADEIPHETNRKSSRFRLVGRKKNFDRRAKPI
jgi:hypothetical protein